MTQHNPNPSRHRPTQPTTELVLDSEVVINHQTHEPELVYWIGTIDHFRNPPGTIAIPFDGVVWREDGTILTIVP